MFCSAGTDTPSADNCFCDTSAGSLDYLRYTIETSILILFKALSTLIYDGFLWYVWSGEVAGWIDYILDTGGALTLFSFLCDVATIYLAPSSGINDPQVSYWLFVMIQQNGKRLYFCHEKNTLYYFSNLSIECLVWGFFYINNGIVTAPRNFCPCTYLFYILLILLTHCFLDTFI